MVDLSHEGAHRFWREYPDPMIYRVVAFMEGVEQWTLDGDPAFEAAVAKLGEELDKVGNYELGMKDEFIKFATYIKAARNLRLLQALDTAHPGAASKLLIHAEESSKSSDDIPGLFLRRNIVFERLRLLGRIFSIERLDLIVKALGGEDV
jgi:intracellular multiplication protein IcmW